MTAVPAPTVAGQVPAPSMCAGGRAAAREPQVAPESADALADARNWTPLYRIGGVAAALLATVTVLHAGVFFVTGLPATVEEWFALFQRSALLGLLAFELLMVIYAVVSVPVALALCVALRRVDPALSALYLALSLVSSITFVLARPAFEMLTLSAGYATATTAAQRALYLAAGEGMLAVFHGTSFWTSYLLGSISGLVLGAAMLRTHLFGRAVPYLRIGSSVFDFGLFIPVVGLYVSLLSVLCLLVFDVLVARRLLDLAAHPRG